MKRKESYIFGVRVLEVTDNKVIVKGYGFLSPRYEDSFKLNELLPDIGVSYEINITLLCPVIKITLFSWIMSMLINIWRLPTSQIEVVNRIVEIAIFIISYFPLIGFLIIIFLLFTRIRYVHYKYSSGVAAFSVGPGLFDRQGQDAFCKRLSEIIENS